MSYIKTEGTIVRANSKVVGDLQSLSGISQKREVKTYKPINTENVVQFAGIAMTDPMSLSVLYDPADAAGVKELQTAFLDNATIPFEIELSDMPSGGTNGTKYTWDGAIISEFSITNEENGAALANFTITVNGLPTVTAAA